MLVAKENPNEDRGDSQYSKRSGDAEVKGGGDAEVKGGGDVEVKDGGDAEVKDGGDAEVKDGIDLEKYDTCLICFDLIAVSDLVVGKCGHGVCKGAIFVFNNVFMCNK